MNMSIEGNYGMILFGALIAIGSMWAGTKMR